MERVLIFLGIIFGMKLFNRLKSSKLLKAGSMSLVATILTRAINLISVPIFSRLLTTSEYGQVEVFMTYVNIFFVVLGLDFHGTVGKGRLDHEKDADEYLCSSMILTTLFSAVAVASEALNQVFGPWLFRRLQEEAYETVRKVQRVYLLLYCVVTVGVLAISPEIVKIIGSKEYWDGTRIIMWVVFATFLNFTHTLYVNIEFFHRKTALISSGTILAALINV